jgi:hypothetical protein
MKRDRNSFPNSNHFSPRSGRLIRTGRGEPVHAGVFFFGLDHSTSRITLRRFIRSSACYSVKCMNDVVPIEYRQQPLHRPPGAPRSQLNVFAQDAPSVLNGANDRILVGIIHGGTQLEKLAI